MHSTTSACTVGHKINLSHAHGATRASSTMDGRRAPPRDGGRRSASVGRARRLARVGRSSASGRSCAAHARARDTHHRPPPNTHTRRRTHTPPDAEHTHPPRRRRIFRRINLERSKSRDEFRTTHDCIGVDALGRVRVERERRNHWLLRLFSTNLDVRGARDERGVHGRLHVERLGLRG